MPLIPCLLAWEVRHPDIPFAVLVAPRPPGSGGGNFASSMANISFFYPEKDKGRALGLNAAGGNIGVAVVQKIIPLIVVAGGGVAISRAGLFSVPLAVVAAGCAFLFMNNSVHEQPCRGPRRPQGRCAAGVVLRRASVDRNVPQRSVTAG